MIEPEKVDNITPNLTRSWLDHGQIVVYHTTQTTREDIDAWYQIVQATARAWPPGKPYLAIHDVRGVIMTPYARERAKSLNRALHDVTGRSAVIIDQTRMGELIGFFVNSIFALSRGNAERRVFTTFEEALAWLRELETEPHAGV